MKEIDKANTTEANATRGSVYIIHKYALTNKPTTTSTSGIDKYKNAHYRVLEQARPRTFYFENILRTEGERI